MPVRLSYMTFLVLALSVQLNGQIKMGEWRTHVPYQFCETVEATNDRIFCSSTGGLFTYRPDDMSVEKLSKIDGFSDIGISVMRWSEALETLVIAYQNSNLDLVRDGVITNIPDLMKKQVPGDKSIYGISIYGDFAYLSTGFGIVVLNLRKDEIKETYYIGDEGEALRVNQVAIDGTYIYAATDQGIRYALVDDPFLVDFNAWTLMEDIPNSQGRFACIAWFNDALFAAWKDPAGRQDEMYYRRADTWMEYSGFIAPLCLELLVHGDFMTLVDSWNVGIINKDFIVVQYLRAPKPRSATMDAEGKVWAASYGDGLMTTIDEELWSVAPNGPRSTDAFALASSQERLYLVQGGIEGASSLFNVSTLEWFTNETWDYTSNAESRDLIDVAIDPSDPDHVYAASWGYGVHEYQNGEEVAWYKVGNSSLQSQIPGGDYVRIGGLAFDPMGNLWMTNTGVAEPISVLKADQSWTSFDVDNLLSSFGALGDILVTRSGHKWAIVSLGNGLFAMDDNGSIDDASDDVYKRVSVVDEFGKVITNDVRAMAEDRNGNLWLGTNQGILVMYSPYRLFSEGSIYAQEILIPRNDGTGFGDPLLGDQVVTCIAVDGANRKWLGTAGGGAYLVSDDGLETIHQFNVLNSPLLSDNITDIAIDDASGEVFIATELGVISYRGDALGGSRDYSNVVVYPNPVRETYHGPVAIKGLVEQTTVKIQDMGGNLVFETESLGGQAIWDGKNFRGERVATGVYMVFLSSADGSLSHVTKLLFIH